MMDVINQMGLEGYIQDFSNNSEYPYLSQRVTARMEFNIHFILITIQNVKYIWKYISNITFILNMVSFWLILIAYLKFYKFLYWFFKEDYIQSIFLVQQNVNFKFWKTTEEIEYCITVTDIMIRPTAV